MTQKLDLNKIKDEIENRKKEKNMVSSNLGEGVGENVAPREEFLTGLLKARETGRETSSSKLIKVVENKIAEKHGESLKHRISEEAPIQRQIHTETSTVNMSPERDEQLYADIEKKTNQTLAESIQAFTGTQPNSPHPSTVNYNGKELLTTKPQSASPQTPQINEGVLVENVKTVVNDYLTENLGPVFEEAIKGTIIEMYAVERIKEVLHENKDLIKSVVIETIRDIQAKNKAKAQK